MNWTDINWMAILPEIIVFCVAVVLLLGEVFVNSASIRRQFGTVTLIGLLATLASIASIWNLQTSEFFGMFAVDFTANVLKAILIIVTSLVVLGVLQSKTNIGEGEFFSLILFSVLGTMFLASASDLVMLFISLELTVIPAYILTASRRTPKSSEAALKYFLLGVVASVILLYGMSLLFGLTGETNFAAIASKLSSGKIEPAIVVAMLMIIVGLGFKVAAVPFHFWAPDVYEGSPIPVASYLAAGPKAGGFAAIIHLLPVALATASAAWASAFAILAVLSMFLGNLAALSQTQVRRLLGYSAVAHTGYLMIGLAAANQLGYTSLIFYFFVYSLAALGAFLVIFAMAERGLGEEIEDFTGLHKRAPMLALAMAIFLFSLVGLPPLAGFMGKLFLFKAAVQSDLIWLALIGVVNSVVSLGYYVMVIRQMYLMKSDINDTVKVSAPLFASIMLIMLAVIVFGLYPTGLLAIIKL